MINLANTIVKAECQRIGVFKLWCWRRLLKVPWTRRSNQSLLREINPEYSLEGLMLKLKFQYFDHLIETDDSLEKSLTLERLRVGGEEDIRRRDGWMASPMHWTWTWQISAGDGEGQGALVCCSPWGCKELDTKGGQTTTAIVWNIAYNQTTYAFFVKKPSLLNKVHKPSLISNT